MSIRIHIILSAIVAIAFVVVVQVFATPQPVFRFLLPAYLGYVIIVAAYNWWYLKRSERFNVWVWLRLPLFLLAWFGLFFLIPSSLVRGAFLLASVPIIFFFESLVGNMGQQLGWNEFLLTMGGLLIGLFGLSFYYILPGMVYLLVVFISTALVVRTSLELVPHNTLVKWVASLSLGLFATELFWVASFLPLHYSALAVVTFNALYVVWIVYYHYLYHTLTLRQIQFHLILALLLTAVMFLSTPWSIQT